MNTYVVLMRGINVGGKNKVPMADLRRCLEELGFFNVTTYIDSVNVILESDKRAAEITARIEKLYLRVLRLMTSSVEFWCLPAINLSRHR
jgi:uncharacterized protein (DUF1697 family)